MITKVKASRPCTLPKDWEGTGLIDSNNGYILESTVCTVSETCTIMFRSGEAVYKKIIPLSVSDYRQAIIDAQIEVALAITDAQRPWLKAEGFEFLEGEVYWVKHKLDETFLLCKHENGEFTPCWSDGTFIRERFAIPSFLERHILAFKPISDSQEAWDAVAHVEVAEV
jgi:hypothetical protein